MEEEYMKIYIDSADINIIESSIRDFRLNGFTCNPSICSKQNADIDALLEIGKSTRSFFQVISKTKEGILIDARNILSKNPNAIVKIPVTSEGLKAISLLSSEGVIVLATAIYSVSQAIMAMKAGAQFIAPYVNRISDNGSDGIKVVSDMLEIIQNQHLNCEIVAASFKNVHQVTSLIQLGVHSVTVPVDILQKLVDSNLTREAVDQFSMDWLKVYGKDQF